MPIHLKQAFKVLKHSILFKFVKIAFFMWNIYVQKMISGYVDMLMID